MAHGGDPRAVRRGRRKRLTRTIQEVVSSRRRLSNARSFLLALPTMTDITGANNAENPVGVPRLRSDIRVAPFSASHVYVVSMGKGAPGVRIVSRLPGTKSTTS